MKRNGMLLSQESGEIENKERERNKVGIKGNERR